MGGSREVKVISTFFFSHMVKSNALSERDLQMLATFSLRVTLRLLKAAWEWKENRIYN